jgi:histidine ammonia-lyase
MTTTIIDKSTHIVDKDWLDIDNLQQISTHKLDLTLSETIRNRINNCRDFLGQNLDNSDCLFYGINMGFGFL